MESQVVEELIEDAKTGKLLWKTKDGELIPVENMRDQHLRNAALFLMDMGYTHCIASREQRVAWLVVLQREWKRRMLVRDADATDEPFPKSTFNRIPYPERKKLN